MGVSQVRADRARRRQSLRWRLPTLISALIVVVLALVLYAAYIEVDSTLAAGAAERARSAADQVAAIFSRSTQQSVDVLQRSLPAVRIYVQDPTDAHLADARAALAPMVPGPNRRITAWNPAGGRLFEIPSEPPENTGSSPVPVLAPTRPPPPGFSPLQAAGDRVFTDLSLTIREATTPAVALGSISVRSAITVSPPDALTRLVGSDARILFGNRTGGAWSDTQRRVGGPAVDTQTDGLKEYRAADGARRIGALSGLQGTPWVVWVEFQRDAVVSRARTFLRRMAFVGLLAAAATVLLVRWFTIRVTTPLAEMTTAAEGMAAGNYSNRVVASGEDEIGRLGRAFNAMTTQVADAQRELEHRVDERTTELHAALTALHERSRERETYLATIVDSSADAIIATDANGIVTSWNRGAETIFGYTAGEIVGTPVMRLIPRESQGDERRMIAGVIGGAEATAVETRRQAKDGRLLDVSITMSPVRDATGAIIGASKVIRDISERNRAITERRTLEQQYQQSQKMEAIGRLAGGVAHDFNNLLTAILGFGKLVLDSLEPGDPRRADVEEIIHAGDRASSLTKQLLSFSRKEVVQPVAVSINEVIVDTDKMLRRLIGEHLEVELVLAGDVGTILADAGQLDQILMNLAVNARDAMPDGGRLTIETANVDLDSSFALLHGPVTPGPYVMLAVTDTGIGMPPEVRSRLFEPFFTTKERGKGTGLGLATVFGIVRQCHGCLYVYSEPGQGASFKLYFPRLADGIHTSTGVTSAPAVELGSETVLLVEDEQAVRHLVQTILAGAGYRVLQAGNPREAEEVLGDRLAEIDALVTDVIMPGGTGPALFAQLRTRHPRLRVLYMSGYTDDATFRTGRLEPGVAFLQKPFAAAVLLRKLREVLDSRPAEA